MVDMFKYNASISKGIPTTMGSRDEYNHTRYKTDKRCPQGSMVIYDDLAGLLRIYLCVAAVLYV